MVYGNAIILMMCGLHKYKYWVEDKMSKMEGETLYEKGITPQTTYALMCTKELGWQWCCLRLKYKKH